jgi:hypothetical protein
MRVVLRLAGRAQISWRRPASGLLLSSSTVDGRLARIISELATATLLQRNNDS